MMGPGGSGWNDPPSLSYETHTQTTARRNLLTKRVGLPDLKLPEPGNGSTLQPSSPPPSGPPPTMPAGDFCEELTIQDKKDIKDITSPDGNAPPLKIFNPLGEASESGDPQPEPRVGNDSIQEIDLMDICFVEELKNLVEKCKDTKLISVQVGQTILKKVSILEKQLLDEKLPKIVEEKMVNLTKYLLVKRYDDAWNIHLSLVCDHSSSVMQWMVGVKRLISEAKKL